MNYNILRKLYPVCDTTIYTMDHPDLNGPNFIEMSICLERLKCAFSQNTSFKHFFHFQIGQVNTLKINALSLLRVTFVVC